MAELINYLIVFLGGLFILILILTLLGKLIGVITSWFRPSKKGVSTLTDVMKGYYWKKDPYTLPRYPTPSKYFTAPKPGHEEKKKETLQH